MALYEFKNSSYSRGVRIQNIEENFNKGMQAVNTPLEEGWARALINYDIVSTGAALAPRPGLQAAKLYTPDSTNGALNIIAAKEQHISATESVMQLLTIEKRADTGYDLRVITSGADYASPTTGDERHNSVVWASYKTSDPIRVNCTVPDKAEIHDIPVNNLQLAKHPGAYAWNGNYYFFDEFNKKIVHTEWDEATKQFKFISADPKPITAKEAVTYGYNMLLDKPYTFANMEGAAGSIIQFQGLMPYDEQGNLCLTPVENQSLSFEVFYTVPLNAKYHIVAEWKNVESSVWEKLTAFDTTFSTLGSIKIPFSPPNKNIIVRVLAYGYTGETRNDYTDATLAVGFNFDKASYGATANTAPKAYSVLKATGLAYWQSMGRLVAWGMPEDQHMLFVSEVNNPTYFPYPSCSDTFEEPIKYVKPLLDNLLVFTSSKLYMLTPSEDGMTWTKKCIQNNLTIADWDIHLIQTVKNMVFFRSGNYYYMMVPKLGSTTGELSLASISKPMVYLFDKFEEGVKEIISNVYGHIEDTLTLKHYYNYLDFEDVHNVYVFETSQQELINFSVLYSTVDRHWRIHITGSPGIMVPYKQNMTRKGLLCMASVQNTDKVVYQVMQYNNRDNRDYYITNYASTAPVQDFEAAHIWRCWQGIDTGYREHASNFKKRYRELQFVINNRSNSVLNFYTNFFIDGEQRVDKYTYNIIHVTDPSSPRYTELIVEKVMLNPLQAPGATTLGETEEDKECWTLDVSSFPETSLWKIRMPVSGKGYAPRVILVSRNEKPYELLNISWIYRPLYSR